MGNSSETAGPVWLGDLRVLAALAVPATVTVISEAFLGVVDMAVVGRLPDAINQGTLAIASGICVMVLNSFWFLASNCSALTSQAMGTDGGPRRMFPPLWRCCALSVVLGLMVALAGRPIVALVEAFGDLDGALIPIMRDYTLVRLSFSPVAFLDFVFGAWFFGQNRGGVALGMMGAAQLANVTLCPLFVLVFGWGVEGAAWSSVIASASSLGVAVVACARIHPGFWVTLRRFHDHFGQSHVVRLLVLNRDLFVRSLLLSVVYFHFQLASENYGVVVLAVNGVLLHALYLSATMFGGLEIALEVSVGNAVGARDPNRARRMVCLAFGLAGVLAVVMGLVWLFSAPLYAALMSDNPEVRAHVAASGLLLAVMPVLMMGSALLDGICVGASQTGLMGRVMVASSLAYAVLAVLTPRWFGVEGLWFALIAWLTLRVALQWVAVPRLEKHAKEGVPSSAAAG